MPGSVMPGSVAVAGSVVLDSVAPVSWPVLVPPADSVPEPPPSVGLSVAEDWVVGPSVVELGAVGLVIVAEVAVVSALVPVPPSSPQPTCTRIEEKIKVLATLRIDITPNR
jgi:hypothetical protein